MAPRFGFSLKKFLTSLRPFMADKAQFVGRWVHWEGIFRIEQELFKNGSFKATIIDESENKVECYR